MRSELTNAVAQVDAGCRYAYAYDDIGNRNWAQECGTNTAYAANALNQYETIGRGVAAAPQDVFIPQYDADGNQTLVKTATGIWRVAYNGENRPIRWKNGDAVIVMSYDRMGRRVTKNDRRFVYDGYLQIAELNQSADDILHSPFSILHSYVWDPTETVATRPLVWRHGGETRYYTHDGNKNVSEVVDAVNMIAAHYDYTPFGAVREQSGALSDVNPFRFSCEYADSVTTTVYYNHRHYEPLTGRWTGRDKTGGLSLNLFVSNRPVGKFDLLGLYGEDVHRDFIRFYLLLLQLHGFNISGVDDMVMGSIAPDEDYTTSPILGIPIDGLGAMLIDSQKVFHNLNGLRANQVRCYRNCVLDKAKTSEGKTSDKFTRGVYLHVLGDTYAHLDSDGNAFLPYIGHAHMLDLPDNVHENPDRFLSFIASLNEVYGVSDQIDRELKRLMELLSEKVPFTRPVYRGGYWDEETGERLRTLPEALEILGGELGIDTNITLEYPSQVLNNNPVSRFLGLCNEDDAMTLSRYRKDLEKVRSELWKCLRRAQGVR